MSDEAHREEAPPLEAAQRAFEAGNYAEVRRLTAELVNAADREIAQEALDLRRRVQVDPVQVVVLLLCLLFLMWVSWKYVFSS